MKILIYSKPKVLIKKRTTLGEGPLWNHKTSELSFVDIMSNKFFVWKKNILKSYKISLNISCLLPTKNKNNWIATSKNKIIKIIKKNKRITTRIIKVINEPKQNRFNDVFSFFKNNVFNTGVIETEVPEFIEVISESR